MLNAYMVFFFVDDIQKPEKRWEAFQVSGYELLTYCIIVGSCQNTIIGKCNSRFNKASGAVFALL